MQSVAQGWLVFRLSDSPLALGFVGFCTFAPILLFALVAGVAADRVPRRKALIWTQGAAMLLALVLAALTWTDVVRVWHVAVIAFGVGITGAFDIPIRQSLLQDLVGRDDLPNAIALNSLAFNGARLVGPALGGFVLAAWGEASVFLINGLSYLAVLIGLARMRLEAGTSANRRASSWIGEIRDGNQRWVRGNSKARIFLDAGHDHQRLRPALHDPASRLRAGHPGRRLSRAGLHDRSHRTRRDDRRSLPRAAANRCKAAVV